jgi:predicted metal-dependent phosphoesterase TrpH
LSLKIDFHTHTAEDPKDVVSYSARELINRAAELGFDALAVANHDHLTFSRELEAYAEKRGILFIPAAEITASDCHVLVVNPQFRPNFYGYSLDDLPRLRSEKSLFIAPHVFFRFFKSLQSRLFPLLPYFDAIEFTSLHNSLINFNRKAVEVARRHGKPVVGNSDCHHLRQFGKTYSLVEARKDLASIVQAVKEGRCEVRTSPVSVLRMAQIFLNSLTVEPAKRLISGRLHPPDR